jgi:predicted metal-dependent enzyme (double-stranded beta helix superfamily)
MGYTLSAFVAALRDALAQGGPEEQRLAAGASALQRLLAQPGALAPYRRALDRGPGPWLLYQDPALGFVVTLLLKPRGNTTPVHHHGEAWTLYGILEGEEVIHHYVRLDDRTRPGHADVRRAEDHVRGPGEVEIEPPFAIHNETTSAHCDTIAIAVRGRDLATVQQEWFDLSSGTVTTAPGRAAAPLPPDLTT